jgi:hypothetical protein
MANKLGNWALTKMSSRLSVLCDWNWVIVASGAMDLSTKSNDELNEQY